MSQLQVQAQSVALIPWDRHVHLIDHPTARNQAVANHDLLSGEEVLSETALAAVLLPEHKGCRCDACFRRSPTLKRCSGCAEYWYCGKGCTSRASNLSSDDDFTPQAGQSQHWKSIHKVMCKDIARFRTTLDFQSSPVNRQMDATLLSEMVAEHGSRFRGSDQFPPENMNDPLATFTSLLPLPTDLQQEPPFICPIAHPHRISPALLKSLFDRFNNNNFIVHSHLTPVGHGIFPRASRLFNHSCVPNAIVTYVFLHGGVQMIVKALSNVSAGDEITIPYFDPALPFQRRQEVSRYTYGFECTCPNCNFCKSVGNSTVASTNDTECVKVGEQLVQHAFPNLKLVWPSQLVLFSLPVELRVVLHETFLPRLSKVFVDAAHDGPHSLALRSGLVLLALYVTVYPSRFPQAGLHCLEMSKTAWNASISDETLDDTSRQGLMMTVRQLLSLALDSLSVLGNEGDEGEGPLLEWATLEELLKPA